MLLALHGSCGTREWYRPRISRLGSGFSCQISKDRNADDKEDPGNKMSCGNVGTEQVEVDVLLSIDIVPEYSGCNKQRLRASALLRRARSRGAEASWIGPEQPLGRI